MDIKVIVINWVYKTYKTTVSQSTKKLHIWNYTYYIDSFTAVLRPSTHVQMLLPGERQTRSVRKLKPHHLLWSGFSKSTTALVTTF